MKRNLRFAPPSGSVADAMALCLTPEIEALTARFTGRDLSLFRSDMDGSDQRLHQAIGGKRILMIGAAGSIGSATLFELIAYGPAAVTVMDTSENNLAELIRTLRSMGTPFEGEFNVEPLDYGSPLAASFLAETMPFDLVLSFAALKHVRSERDSRSLLRMLEVNLVKADRFLGALRLHGHGNDGVFLVSTDKAADPINLMGASKRAMESLLWFHGTPGNPATLLDGGEAPALNRVTTARFANVAFSDGSLPWAFLRRLEKGQPLAAPEKVRRYFVSLEEAGQLCLLTATLCPGSHVMVPKMEPERDGFSFVEIAHAVLEQHGLEPKVFRNEAKARLAVAECLEEGTYPLLLTAADTSGEKLMETFVALDEETSSVGLESFWGIAGQGTPDEDLATLLRMVDDACRGSDQPAMETLVAAINACVPALDHAEGKSLDDRM
jgi:FlaA1/EpsC-like NDP-sugar epimerase